MVTNKPKVVIIGAGMAGLTAANKLYTASKELFELCVLEAGNRIGGRINTSEFGGDRIEMGATWIHGIRGSPVYRIAQEIHSLESQQPWECMDGSLEEPVTIAEGGYELTSSMVDPISTLFTNLMNFAQGKADNKSSNGCCIKNGGQEGISIGSFLRKGLAAYWESRKQEDKVKGFDGWTRKSLEEAIFAMLENTQRTYTSADDLQSLDFNAESEYKMFPGEEITIPKGYFSIIESLASVLPPGLIQLGRKVAKIGWSPDGHHPLEAENGDADRAVKLHLVDGSIIYADHVIITVSLGVLKQGIREDPGFFDPPLPTFKTQAISRLGFGVVNKLFLQIGQNSTKFPNLQMVFHQSHPKLNQPWWMRRTASLRPIYTNSSVILSWFAGKEALQLESLSDEEIIDGVSTTISNFLPNQDSFKIVKALKTKWGTDPLFLGSYSYVAVGSSGDDLDTMAETLPSKGKNPLQILFAGEATHRTHYSTTHGAYFSGLREANRLLQHYIGGV